MSVRVLPARHALGQHGRQLDSRLERGLVANLDRLADGEPELVLGARRTVLRRERLRRCEVDGSTLCTRRHRRIKALLPALTVVAIGVGAAAPASSAAPFPLRLPPPSASRPIGLRTLDWVDPSRRDPLAPGKRLREVLVTIRYPAVARGQTRAPYMPAGAAAVFERVNGAPPGTFHALRTFSYRDALVAPGRHPVVLFSPAFGFTSALYTSLLEELAADGYVVVAVDPTYEAFAVEFPGGRVVTPNLPKGLDALRRILDVRVADTRFVLDRLELLARRGRFAGALDLDRIGMLGHSMGGATAANALLLDPRVRAAADLDGSILGPVVGRDLERPFLLVTSEDAFGEDPTLQSLWPHLKGPRFNLVVRRSGHYTYSDLVALLPQFGAAVPPRLQYEPIGHLSAARAIPAVRACVAGFFDRFLRGRRGEILTDPSRVSPDVRALAGG